MIALLLFTFWAMPVLQVGAEEVSVGPKTAPQESKLVKFLSRENPKWSVELGGGKAFHLNSGEIPLNGYGDASVFTARVGYTPSLTKGYLEIQGEYAGLGGFGARYFLRGRRGLHAQGRPVGNPGGHRTRG